MRRHHCVYGYSRRSDTSAVEPLYSPVEHSTPYRADEPVQKNMHSDVLANAPETDGQFFVVPRIV